MEFKQIALADAELKFLDDTGAFTGYASVFGGHDSHGDTIHKGAYDQCVGEGAEVKMYFNHGWLKSELPIGKMFVQPDEKGLRVVHSEFTKGIRLADEVALATKHGTVNGLSIGFVSTPEQTKRKAGGGRDIYGIKALKEVSVVDWPSDRSAVLDVKSFLDEAQSLKEIESLLRDASGFSKTDATALVSRIKSLVRGEREADQASELSAAIAALTQKLNY